MPRAKEDGTRGELPSGDLASKEVETLRLIARGLTSPTVAGLMGVSYQTVKNRLVVVRHKLRAKTTAHAVAIAKERRII